MILYLDIIFLENLCMNYIILFATGIITKNKIKKLRIFISSMIGSIYVVISIFSIFQMYTNIFFKILISVLLVHIAYSPKNIKELISKLMVFYLTSFAFGGCAYALLYIIKPQNIFMKNGLYIGTYPLKIALLGGLIGFSLIVNVFKMIKNKMNKKDIYCYIEIEFNNKKACMKSLVDTGNMLKDPISNMPVIVVEKEILNNMIPKEILENIENIICGNNEKFFEIIKNTEIANKFRLIPFSSLGNQHGLILGFKADNVHIEYNDEIKETKKVIVGIYSKKLSKGNTYNALIGLDTIIEEDNKDEYIKCIKS